METFKPTTPFRGRAAILASTFLIAPLIASETQNGANLSATEVSRRNLAIEEAQELLRKGDESYTAGRYAESVEAYAGARDLIPDAPISAELRAAATERFAQASVEHARVLSRKGDVAGAKATVDKVLLPAVDPENPGALAFRAQLEDPVRTNPALTAEHAKNVDDLRRLLYTAEGAFNLGKFDDAATHYQSALRIDPTNTAARRGLERAASAKSGHAASSYDHTRAELLSQVDQQWELQPADSEADVSAAGPDGSSSAQTEISIRNKIDRIIIPKLSLDQASLDEALELLRLRAREYDTFENDPHSRG